MSRDLPLSPRRLERRLARAVVRDPVLAAVRRTAEACRVEVWLVGGAVRDAALGAAMRDVDLVAGRGARRLVGELRSAWGTHGFRFRKRDVTTWRFAVRDRRVDVVDGSRRGLRRDLLRRELTVNAVAFDLCRRRVEDPLHGLADLRARRLRLPRPGVFFDDPLRALRVCRFLAEFPRFRLEAGTRDEARAVARRLRRASPERVRQELDKLLLATDAPRGLDALVGLGLLPALLPELVPLDTCAAGGGRPDVWTHTLLALGCSCGPRRLPGARFVRETEDLRVLRWALLLHDIAKPETRDVRPDGRATYHGHEVLGARRADALLRRLRFARAPRARVCRLVREHLRPGHLADAGGPTRGVRRLVRDLGADLPLLVYHAACDARGSGAEDAARRWRRLRVVLRALLDAWEARPERLPRLVDGRDVMRLLGLRPGPEVGRVLERVRELQEGGEIRSRAEALRRLPRLAGDA